MTVSENVSIDLLPAPVFFLSNEGYIHRVNKEGLQLFNYKPGTLTGKPATTLFDTVDDMSLEYLLEQTRKNGRRISEHWLIKATGEKFWGEITVSPADTNDLSGFC